MGGTSRVLVDPVDPTHNRRHIARSLGMLFLIEGTLGQVWLLLPHDAGQPRAARGHLRPGPGAGHLDAPRRPGLRAAVGAEGDDRPGDAAGGRGLRLLRLDDDRLRLPLPVGHPLRGLLRPASGRVPDRARGPRPHRLAGRARRTGASTSASWADGCCRRRRSSSSPRSSTSSRASSAAPTASASSPRASAPRPRRGARPPSASAPTARRPWRASPAWRCARPTGRCCSTRPCAC